MNSKDFDEEKILQKPLMLHLATICDYSRGIVDVDGLGVELFGGIFIGVGDGARIELIA